MKRKYVNPCSDEVIFDTEGVIALSFDKSDEHADGDFVELTKKKDQHGSGIWGERNSVWK